MNDHELTDKILTEHGYTNSGTGHDHVPWTNGEGDRCDYRVWTHKDAPVERQLLVRYHPDGNTDVFAWVGGVMQESSSQRQEERELDWALRQVEKLDIP